MENKIINIIKDIIKSKYQLENVDVQLTKAKNHGDFSTNVGFILSNVLKDNPEKISNEIAQEIKDPFIIKVMVANKGFINIFLNDSFYTKVVQDILHQKENYGKGNENKYINIEYISANPTGFLHLGHARIGAMGNTLANILKFNGNKVDQEFYINDQGNQMNILGHSTWIRYNQILNNPMELPENSYQGQEIIDVAQIIVDKYGSKFLKEKYSQVEQTFIQEAKEFMLTKIKEHLKLFDIEMDIYFSEKALYENDFINQTIKEMKNTYVKDGATWLKTTLYGDDKDRVLIKNDQTFTYFSPDIAYHKIKIAKGYNELINIWGADHIGYIERLKAAIQELGFSKEAIDILLVQTVKLFKNNQEFKMSKRKGTSFTLIDLIDLVGKDAARFYLISLSNTTPLDFDINVATTKDQNNFVFQIQYAHARIAQLLNKSSKKPQSGLYLELEKELIMILYKFNGIIKNICKTHKIHLITQYLIELTRIFNAFYSQVKIINTEREGELLGLSKACQQIIATCLKLICVNAPDKM